MNIGIFGGAFNPPTYGHVDVARRASQFYDSVWFVPSADGDHPFNKSTASIIDRNAMLTLAIQGIQKLEVCLLEAMNHTKYTCEFCQILKERFCGMPVKFDLIIGSDNAMSIESWKNSHMLISTIQFCVIQRGPVTSDAWFLRRPHRFIPNVSDSTISSTIARQKLLSGEDVSDCLDPLVEQYIKMNGLYK